jgi:hypothetical protein
MLMVPVSLAIVVLKPALNSLSSKLDEPQMSPRLGDGITLPIYQFN